MLGEVSDILRDVTINLCSYLHDVLPSLSKTWWVDCVQAKLPPESQSWIKTNRVSSLSNLDLSRLLQVFLKNWHAISQHRTLSQDLRNYANEMKSIRNRWAHLTAELPSEDDIDRDLDTLRRFCIGIMADRKVIDKIEGVRAKIRRMGASPITLPPEEPVSILRRNVRVDHPFGRPKPSSPPSAHVRQRKPRDPQLEVSLKMSVGSLLRADLREEFTVIGSSILTFRRSGRRYLCKFSSFDNRHLRWFWGVSRNYWVTWAQEDHLVLILENWESPGFSYILFDPQLSKQLLARCGQDKKEEKKINMTISGTEGRIRLQEWGDLPIETMIRPLPGSKRGEC